MHVESIAKRTYAFGLTWTESTQRAGKADIRNQRSRLDPSGRERFYTCVIHSQGHFALGCGIAESSVKGTVYSYAATLAAHHADGLYVARVDEEHLWFAVIADGIVTPETDVIDTTEKVLERVEDYRTLLYLDPQNIHATEGIYIAGGSQLFDPIEAVAAVRKPVAMTATSGRMSLGPWVYAAAAVAVVIVGLALWHAHEAAKSKQQLSADQRKQMIQTYHLAVQAALSAYPREAGWVLHDWTKVTDTLPPFYAGWTLSDINCTPTGCDGTYKRQSNLSAYAVTPFTDRFGVGPVSIDPQAHSIKVHVSLQNATLIVDDTLLHSPPPVGQQLLDWLGLTPNHVSGLSEQPTTLVVNLATASGGSQVGYPAFLTETVGFNGNTPMVVALPSIVAWGKHAGFHVTAIDFTTPYSGSGATATWAITLLRFHG